MKSKPIFIILFFSFLFNISHDITLGLESKDNCPAMVQIMEETTPIKVCNDISSLHYFLHFLAILDYKDHFFSKKNSYKIEYERELIFPIILNSLFKPPIA